MKMSNGSAAAAFTTSTFNHNTKEISAMNKVENRIPSRVTNLASSPRLVPRRSFLRSVGLGAVALAPGAALLSGARKTLAKNENGNLREGDVAILKFLAAAEILESDLWEQYWELGGLPFGENVETPRGESRPSFSGGNAAYIAALQILDGDMPQYITDNTDDEFSHQAFIRAFLVSKGASTEDIDLLAGPTFRTIPGSTATGSSGKKRLTNLTQLTIDTSYWGRYRSDDNNPDLDAAVKFAQAVPSLNNGKHTAIPRTDADANNADLINAIAFTAGFHFAFIEQGGTSLYPSLAQRVTDPEVLRILLSIGPTETMHFQTWQDKAGNANTNPNGPPGNRPFKVFDPINNSTVTFFDLHFSQPETLQANLIMPEPCPFLSRSFPNCSIIRPTETKGAAMGAVKALTADGLFIGQSQAFFDLISRLAEEADEARREG
jgi:Ferritin-like domain